MTIGGPTICVACRLLRRTQSTRADGSDGLVCDAYPDGVPDAIAFGGFDHRKPYRGDNGVLFALDTNGDWTDADVDLILADVEAFKEESR